MRKPLALLPIVLLFSCAQPPSVRPPQNTLAYKVDTILKNPSLSTEQKKRLILALFAQKRKVWSGENVYKKERALKTAELLRSPITPLRIPPKIMRVLILPWVDKNGVFHDAHYVFVQVDEGRWVLGSYVRNLKPSKTLTPLEGEGR